MKNFYIQNTLLKKERVGGDVETWFVYVFQQTVVLTNGILGMINNV